MDVIEFISQPWHWAVAGTGVAIVALLLLYVGERFGISSSFETICTIGGAGKWVSYFKVDWKQKQWLLLFVLGSMIGGYLGVTVLQSPAPVEVAAGTVNALNALGVTVPVSKSEGLGFIPMDVINFNNLWTLKGVILMLVGGFMIGFGTRWAGGCTSGHSISGISNLQPASLIATIGFFVGGIITTFLLFPIIFNL